MFRYAAFCLNFESAVPLPELLPGEGAADVIIRLGSAGPTPDEQTPIFCDWAAPGEARISWGKVASARILGGEEIIIEPYPGVSEDAVRLFLLGAGLGVLLHQRGLTVLHGSAVSVNRKVAAFIGDKGWGKSTTAAALYARGHTLLSDDLVAIRYGDQGAEVLPAFPQAKLWPDAIASLGGNPDQLPRVRPEITKRAQALDSGFANEPLPLGTIYLLGGGQDFAIEPIPGQIAFLNLVRQMYVARFGSGFSRATGHESLFTHCSKLVKYARVCRLVRQPGLNVLDQMAVLVENDLKSLSNQAAGEAK